VTLSGDSPVMNGTSNVMGEHPTMEEVKEWDKDELLKWIQQKRPKLLTDDDDVEKFKAAKIPGDVFLTLAGDVKSFQKNCHLPFGPSKGLANLAEEIARREIKQETALHFESPIERHNQAPILLEGALTPRATAMMYPITNREVFLDVYTGVLSNASFIIHGPYQSGKT